MNESNSCVNNENEMFCYKGPVPHTFAEVKKGNLLKTVEVYTEEEKAYPIVKRDALGTIDYKYHDKRARKLRSDAVYKIVQGILRFVFRLN